MKKYKKSEKNEKVTIKVKNALKCACPVAARSLPGHCPVAIERLLSRFATKIKKIQKSENKLEYMRKLEKIKKNKKNEETM